MGTKGGRSRSPEKLAALKRTTEARVARQKQAVADALAMGDVRALARALVRKEKP
jgi:hypothetical protein